MSELLLGIDIGTSSSKGVLARPDGTVVATAERPHNLSLPRPGWAEHSAEEVWWADFRAIVEELLPKSGGAISAVCVSGIGPCLLPATDNGEPLRPAILYGIDTRATKEIAELTERYGADTILARGGSALTSQAIGPKLLWLRRNEPEVWARTKKFFMASSFIAYRLTGEYVLDHHSASQCDPLYSISDNRWINEWAEDIAPGLPLPRLLWPSEVAGRITPEAAQLTGLPEGIPVAAGTIDAWSEAISVGVKRPGDLMLMYGTTMFMVQVLRDVVPDPKLWVTAGVFKDTQTVAAGMATSGALTGWLREIAGGILYETLVEEAAAIPAGSNGLITLPYFAGERTPLFDPKARGVICGLTLSHRRGHLYRSLLEATAYGVRHILETILGSTPSSQQPEPRIIAVGGGTKGGLWPRIVSDVTGRPQEIPQHTIGASYGDAYLAAVALGLIDPGVNWNPTEAVVQPNSENRPAYDELYRVYRELYPATLSQVHTLADIQAHGL